MTRSIKFRVWDTKNTEFCPSSTGQTIHSLIYNSLFYDKQYIFQQFTGLLDKNGKEIYEGDIIQEFPDCCDKSVINWSKDGLWYALSLDSESGMGNELYMYPKCQVIGNIFENPSLLSKKSLTT